MSGAQDDAGKEGAGQNQPALSGPRQEAASGRARQLVLLLHGYGANGADLFGLAEPLAALLPDAVFVSPDAPEPCRVNPVGFQWFPIPWIDGSSEAEMAPSFARSADRLERFIEAECAALGLGRDACALLGFSQGSMMALHVGLRQAEPLAGVVGVSGRLVAPERLASELRSRPPVLLIHGDQDDVVPYGDMAAAEAALTEAGVSVRAHTSRGVGHGIAPDGLQMAAGFLKSVLNPAR